jgi:hypothetical protein
MLFSIVLYLWPCSQCARRAIAVVKQLWLLMRSKICYLDLLRTSEGKLSRCGLVPAAFVVFSTHQAALGPRGGLWLWLVLISVIHKEGLCPSSGDINRLVMMIHCIEDFSDPAVSAFSVRLRKLSNLHKSRFSDG